MKDLDRSLSFAGFGWPTCAEPQEVWSNPGSLRLMLDSEARHHYAAYRRQHPDHVALWRPVGSPPAILNYDPDQYVASLLRTWPEQEHWGEEHLVVGNEFNLNYERGDNRDDWDREVMDGVYWTYGRFLELVHQRLHYWRSDGSSGADYVYLHWPAWTPGHYVRDYAHHWVETAKKFDVIDFHAYGTLEEIQEEYDWYSSTFPDHPICLTEWHSGDMADTAEEARILRWLRHQIWADERFMGACFFIWHWGPGRTHIYNIEGNAERELMFRFPFAQPLEAAA